MGIVSRFLTRNIRSSKDGTNIFFQQNDNGHNSVVINRALFYILTLLLPGVTNDQKCLFLGNGGCFPSLCSWVVFLCRIQALYKNMLHHQKFSLLFILLLEN